MSFDIDAVRAQFPALALTDNGRPRLYLDNPGGTQVSRFVIERMTDCLVRANANLGGFFATSVEAGRIVDEARAKMAAFLNAAGPEEIVFGQNMTTLTFHLQRSIGRRIEPGDEILLTRMDHDGNVAPWLAMARERGATVKWIDVDPESFALDLEPLDALLTDRTRLVAINHASNATGTISDVARVAARARAVGALTYVDAVQSAPHLPIDVAALGCDILVCSAYKFFGPHQGTLWGRHALLEALVADKVRPASDVPPEKFETGTQSHEGIAGIAGAIDYFAWVGETMARDALPRFEALPEATRPLHAAMECLCAYEMGLTRRLLDGLAALPGIAVVGITERQRMAERVPTVSFVARGHAPAEVAKHLADHNIFVWSGHNYAVEVIRRLGLEASGGVVRIGIAHYNTEAEIDRALEALGGLLR
jgi:cysteine desulfurase family protein (TIGR01976 family)